MSVPTEARRQAIHDAEQWFLRHGLPYFVESERLAVKRGLRRGRLVPVVATALLLGAVAGVGTGLLTTLSLGLLVGLLVAGVVLATYAGTTLRLRVIARWAVGRTFRSIEYATLSGKPRAISVAHATMALRPRPMRQWTRTFRR